MNGALSCSTLNGISCSVLRSKRSLWILWPVGRRHRDSKWIWLVSRMEDIGSMLRLWLRFSYHGFQRKRVGFYHVSSFFYIFLFRARFMVSWVQESRSHPTLPLPTVLGINDFDQKVAWRWGCSLGLLMMSPSTLILLSCRTSLRGRICVWSQISALPFGTYTSSSVLALLMLVVSIFNWKEFSFDVVVSVGCNASRPKNDNFETHTALKTWTVTMFETHLLVPRKCQSVFNTGRWIGMLAAKQNAKYLGSISNDLNPKMCKPLQI